MPLANLDWCPNPPGIQPLPDDNSVGSIRSESCTLVMGGGDSALVWLKVDEVSSSRPGLPDGIDNMVSLPLDYHWPFSPHPAPPF